MYLTQDLIYLETYARVYELALMKDNDDEVGKICSIELYRVNYGECSAPPADWISEQLESSVSHSLKVRSALLGFLEGVRKETGNLEEFAASWGVSLSSLSCAVAAPATLAYTDFLMEVAQQADLVSRWEIHIEHV